VVIKGDSPVLANFFTRKLGFINYSGAGLLRCAPRGRGGDIFCAEVPIGESTTIMAAAVKAAYLPTFIRASLRVIFSSLTGM
jgi:hypothetical protein